jgi:hypothetical protein
MSCLSTNYIIYLSKAFLIIRAMHLHQATYYFQIGPLYVVVGKGFTRVKSQALRQFFEEVHRVN